MPRNNIDYIIEFPCLVCERKVSTWKGTAQEVLRKCYKHVVAHRKAQKAELDAMEDNDA